MFYCRTCQNSHHEQISSCYSAPPDQTSYKASSQFEQQKGIPNVCIIHYSNNRAFKRLFCVKLTQILTEVRVLINIDESIIDKDICIKYFWLEKEKAWSITNIVSTKSINVISAVTTDEVIIFRRTKFSDQILVWFGSSNNMFKYTTATKETVKVSIKYILKYLRLKMHLNLCEVGIV